MVRLMVASLGVLVMVAGMTPRTADAQMMCGERTKVIAGLEQGYSEKPTSMGLTSNGAVVEVLSSPSGTFTIIVTQPNGLTCLMASGEDWEELPDIETAGGDHI